MIIDTKLRCFVAMAFGHDDTDYLYDNYIKPAIQNIGFYPVRVDKLTHNDRIDEKIRTEIQKSSVVIADLTYTRPSVYWEAGYAERSIPVIYTCRQDHFSPKTDDIYGNFKVHFDLANANILTWSGEKNTGFKEELQKRLLFVTTQTRKNKDLQVELDQERKAFSLLSLTERENIVTKSTLEILLNTGFFRLDILPADTMTNDWGVVTHSAPILFWKNSLNSISIISSHPCYASLTKKQLEHLEAIPSPKLVE
jgi:nucleoside 2-deoxyribosyltransferase